MSRSKLTRLTIGAESHDPADTVPLAPVQPVLPQQPAEAARHRRDLGQRAVPAEAALAAVLRYEPHLSRELACARDQLERARALRKRR